MKKKVKFTCSKLSEGFISECEVVTVSDFENPNLFKVTTVYNQSYLNVGCLALSHTRQDS